MLQLAVPLVEEDIARGRIKEVYEDIKATMRVPFVPTSFRAFAAYPEYLELVWAHVKPNVGTAAFEEWAAGIRHHSDADASHRFRVSDHVNILLQRGTPYETIHDIRDTVEVFHYLDPRLLILLAGLVESQEKQAPVGNLDPTPREVRRVDVPSFLFVPVRLVRPELAPHRVRRLLNDIKAAMQMPVVPGLYRALAAWPDYLELAWKEVKPALSTRPYGETCAELREIASRAAYELPSPLRIDDDTLVQAGLEADLREIRQLNQLFADLLPRLILNTSILWKGLREGVLP